MNRVIERISLRDRVNGPGISFADAVIRSKAREYSMAQAVDSLEDVGFGVRVTIKRAYDVLSFDIPWPSIAFAQGVTEEQAEEEPTKPAKRAKRGGRKETP